MNLKCKAVLEDVLKVAIVLGRGKAFGKQAIENSGKSSPECFAPTDQRYQPRLFKQPLSSKRSALETLLFTF
jgi:hypothetical protein